MSDFEPQIRGVYSGADANVSVSGHARDKGYVLTFTHIATGHRVSFPAVIQSFSDNHKAQANEQVYANNPNPLITQGGTGREISLSFLVLSASIDEARYNTQSVNMLLQMLYPKLREDGTMRSAPRIRISGFNMLKDGRGVDSATCIIQNITYALNTEEGYVTAPGELHPVSLTIDVSAIAYIPTAPPEDVESDNWHQPYPSDYPRYR